MYLDSHAKNISKSQNQGIFILLYDSANVLKIHYGFGKDNSVNMIQSNEELLGFGWFPVGRN